MGGEKCECFLTIFPARHEVTGSQYTLLARESENEVMETRVTNSSFDNVGEAVVPGSGTNKILSTLEGVGIELQSKNRKVIE